MISKINVIYRVKYSSLIFFLVKIKQIIVTSSFIFISTPLWADMTFSPLQFSSQTLQPLQSSSWQEFEESIHLEKKKRDFDGWSYIVSGSLIAVGSVVGYSLAADPFTQLVYVLSQTLGVVGIGYGIHLLVVPSEYEIFHSTLSKSQDLSNAQKEILLFNFQSETEKGHHQNKILRTVFHSIIAALNFYNGSHQENSTLKNTLYFMGIINTFSAISIAF